MTASRGAKGKGPVTTSFGSTTDSKNLLAFSRSPSAGFRCRRRIGSSREGMLERLSLGTYVTLVDYTGGLFREGKATISREKVTHRRVVTRNRDGDRLTSRAAQSGNAATSGCSRSGLVGYLAGPVQIRHVDKAVLVVMPDPIHEVLVRAGLVAALEGQIEVEIRAHCRLIAPAEARIGVVDGPCIIFGEYAQTGQFLDQLAPSREEIGERLFTLRPVKDVRSIDLDPGQRAAFTAQLVAEPCSAAKASRWYSVGTCCRHNPQHARPGNKSRSPTRERREE